MGNGYDAHSLAATGLREISSSSLRIAATRTRVAAYPGGTATRRRGALREAETWTGAQAATTPPIPPRDALSPSGLRESFVGMPGAEDARIALAVLAQFADGETVQAVQDAIEDQFGALPRDRAEEPTETPGDEGPAFLGEAPLDARRRNRLPDSAFALPGRKYPIDTPARARSALSRVEQFGSEEDKRRVRAAVRRRYPNMKVE